MQPGEVALEVGCTTVAVDVEYYADCTCGVLDPPEDMRSCEDCVWRWLGVDAMYCPTVNCVAAAGMDALDDSGDQVRGQVGEMYLDAMLSVNVAGMVVVVTAAAGSMILEDSWPP